MDKIKCVYCISCKTPTVTDFYIGYTTNLVKRKQQHKFFTYYEKDGRYNHKLYKTIRENGGFDNWEFNIIEEDCGRDKEKYWYEALDPTLNINHCGHTASEYRKAYYASERGRGITLTNLRKKVNCEHCGKEMNKSSISRHLKKSCPILFPDVKERKSLGRRKKKNKDYEIEVIKEKVEIIF